MITKRGVLFRYDILVVARWRSFADQLTVIKELHFADHAVAITGPGVDGNVRWTYK